MLINALAVLGITVMIISLDLAKCQLTCLLYLFWEVIKYAAKNCCLLLLQVCLVSLEKMLHFSVPVVL